MAKLSLIMCVSMLFITAHTKSLSDGSADNSNNIIDADLKTLHQNRQLGPFTSVANLLSSPLVQSVLTNNTIQAILSDSMVREVFKNPMVQNILRNPMVQNILKNPSIQGLNLLQLVLATLQRSGTVQPPLTNTRFPINVPPRRQQSLMTTILAGLDEVLALLQEFVSNTAGGNPFWSG